MIAMGISDVRIGEFAWSMIEPSQGVFEWSWLDKAVDVLGDKGLRVVMGTPTACPPKWLVDRHPEILAVDEHGQARKFGSRRHYCFSSLIFRAEAARIVTAVAERYGTHPAVQGWQTDNEYGCHDTTISYSDAAARGFRAWLAERYGDIAVLNKVWGTVFWSQTYRDFAEIDPPASTVTEANPSHRLDYWRYSSDQVVAFNRMQVEILRGLSPGRDIVHNFMGFYTEFDAFKVARDLDVAAWDSYPLGFTEQFWFSEDEKKRYMRQGQPDIAAFHHDLYRGCGSGRMWVMEQQPGPVNWAAFNPAPLPGMVRTWTWEAFAHGAELVSYFRWRQVPVAQEQMHAGLHLPDGEEDVAADEVREVAREIKKLGPLSKSARSPVALVFSFEADWMLQIQPQAQGFRWLRLAFEFYEALRRLGIDVDIVPTDASLLDYKLVVVPSLPHADDVFVRSLEATSAFILLGARSGSKTHNLSIVPQLPPGGLSQLIDLRVTRVESLSPRSPQIIQVGNQTFEGKFWREHIRTFLNPIGTFADGSGAWYRQGRVDYLATWPAPQLLDHVLSELVQRAGLTQQHLQEGVRTRDRDGLRFTFNYSNELRLAPAPADATFVIGDREMKPGGLAAWQI